MVRTACKTHQQQPPTGKKQSSGKEKKLLRKAETEKAQQARASVISASEVTDLLDAFPSFKTFDRNGLTANIAFFHSKDLQPQVVEWMLSICKENMKEMYEAVWGWSDSKKLKELRNENARFLLAFEPNQELPSPLALIHFRFEDDDGLPVLYVYEIQLEARCQRKGLGKLLMLLMELVAAKLQMQAVMLTVMQANTAALTFYSRLDYTRHPSSPDEDGPGYFILHKPIRTK